MKKILTIVGARPQFIKAAAVSKAILARKGLTEVLVHTGQHYDENMSDVFFRQLGVPAPKVNLAVGSGSHAKQTADMLIGIDTVIASERPDCVLVYGDTNSTLAGALAAVKVHVPVAHVEAGLRSFNRKMPEEMNRILTDICSTFLFVPTPAAVKNLEAEGISGGKVHQVGDVMFDAALQFGAISDSESQIIAKMGLKKGGFVLATIHRAENTDDMERLTAIMEGLAIAARDLPVILPLHPRTKKIVAERASLAKAVAALKIIDPVSYFDMIQLEKSAALVATDSGGVQKEAYFFGVPCITLRDESEWMELVEAGWNKIVPPRDAAAIARAILDQRGSRGRKIDVYGDGTSAEMIAAELERSL